MSEALIVFGSGGHGKVVADAALAAGWDVLGFADGDPAKRSATVLGLPIVASDVDELATVCASRAAKVVLGIGDNDTRERLFHALLACDLELATIIHPSSVIAPSATIGRGTVVFAGVIVNPDSRVGEDVILNTAASIDHDNVIGDHAHVSPGARLGGTVTVGELTHVGIGSAIRNNIDIGARSIIGAGSVVVANIPDDVVAYGNPARVQRPR